MAVKPENITLEFEYLYFSLSDNIPVMFHSFAQARQGKGDEHFFLTSFNRINWI